MTQLSDCETKKSDFEMGQKTADGYGVHVCALTVPLKAHL